MFQKWKDKIRANMGLKFVLTLSAWIAVLLIVGTIFVARMLLNAQYSATEARGRETGTVLGKAIIDRLISSDLIGLNMLTEDLVKSPDILSIVIVSMDGVPITTARSSFSKSDTGVQAILAEEKTEDVKKLQEAIRSRLEPIDVSTDIMLEGTKLGQVQISFSPREARANAEKIVVLLLGTSMAIVLSLSLMVYAMVRRMIVLPTREAGTVASNIAGGDLTKTVHVKSMDELGMLGRGLNKMIIGLKGMVGNVLDAARKTESVWGEVKTMSSEIAAGSRTQSESVEEAASSVNEMYFALKEIGGNVDDLFTTSEQTSSSVIETAASVAEVAKTMSELSSSIEETTTAITQMSAAIRQIAENVEQLSSAAEQTAASSAEISASVKEVESTARQSATLAEDVASDARELGMRSIEKTIEGMGRIESNARHSAEVVNRLGERAESIGGILTVIEDITDQTSLLALNAAILAAQAGEHGKGFAVVAAEIRELANRTAASTQEIGKLITAVQGESREAVGAMKEGTAIVDEGMQLATDAGAALRKILERAERSRDMSRSIDKATAEQTRGIGQVREAVERINEMTHQIAKAANEQKGGSEQIMRAAEKMREITRFVKSSMEEQAKAGKNVTEAVERISSKIGMVNKATGELQAGSDLIVKAIDRIKSIAKANADLAAGLTVSMDVMAQQSGTLKKEIEKFKTEAPQNGGKKA